MFVSSLNALSINTAMALLASSDPHIPNGDSTTPLPGQFTLSPSTFLTTSTAQDTNSTASDLLVRQNRWLQSYPGLAGKQWESVLTRANQICTMADQWERTEGANKITASRYWNIAHTIEYLLGLGARGLSPLEVEQSLNWLAESFQESSSVIRRIRKKALDKLKHGELERRLETLREQARDHSAREGALGMAALSPLLQQAEQKFADATRSNKWSQFKAIERTLQTIFYEYHPHRMAPKHASDGRVPMTDPLRMEPLETAVDTTMLKLDSRLDCRRVLEALRQLSDQPFLTHIEQEILRGLLEGDFSISKYARRLSVSPSTIKKAQMRLQKKLRYRFLALRTQLFFV